MLDGNSFYDFDLEQWGFSRYENEKWSNYLKRLRDHNAFKTKNISSWDLSLDGAKELNGYLIASPDIYYFSLVSIQCQKCWKISDFMNSGYLCWCFYLIFFKFSLTINF